MADDKELDKLSAVIKEREECGQLADKLGSPKIARAIWARTCDENGGHSYEDNGVCGVCGTPRIHLVE